MKTLLGGRSLKTIAGAVFDPRHYRAAKNMLLKYPRPFDGMVRYLFATGDYPTSITIKTPTGNITATIYSHDDMLTVNEIFCREDYRCPSHCKTIVDFGSNIGISALYFLSRCPDAFVYLFEPLPQNAERLRKNLRGFENRYEFFQTAVALTTGEVEFGYDETGRYGGIGIAHKKKIRVPCRSANEILNELIIRRGDIDVLKIDIESLEKEILLSLPDCVLRRIKNIFLETKPMFTANPLAPTHGLYRYGNVARFHIIRSEPFPDRLGAPVDMLGGVGSEK